MSIQSLSAELANQIAAGEVVERPASVVKELVENSIDSGATKIEIDIQQGGHKQILVRDNGSGIPKEELGLALSRHATSKIKTLDDLEAIISMGFRGEALASISSVSRLTLTSKPAAQSAAWQAHTQGRDMAVEINPAAHPNGTTVDVVDLFFNTPARRRFLRTEKTEFAHIEQVVKRIALANKAVEFILRHNGRRVKHVKSTEVLSKRLTDLLGQTDSNVIVPVTAQTPEVALEGVIVNPLTEQNTIDWQYSFVNQRPMRDKLINHAIKQAFELLGLEASTPQYVLFVDVEPSEVDVNVHPAKHEVRFHQARLVHDFIVSAVKQALSALSHDQTEALAPHVSIESAGHGYEPVPQLSSVSRSVPGGSAGSGGSSNRYSPAVSPAAGQAYTQLMQVNDSPAINPTMGVIQAGRYFIFSESQADHCYVGSIKSLIKQKLQRELEQCERTQPLLMPVAISSCDNWSEALRQSLEQQQVIVEKVASKLVLKQVPAGWRAMPWSTILDKLLDCKPIDIETSLIEMCSEAVSEQPPAIQGALAWLQSLPQEHQIALVETLGAQVEVGALLSD